jgi:hypothetical protein
LRFVGEIVSFPYVIRHEKLELDITISDIADLYLHEEVVPELLDELMRAIDLDGYLKHPVIVDGGSHVVLDGMHRVAALEELGCARVPVCLVDYESPAISVGCWYRTIRGAGGAECVVAEVEKIGFVVEEVENVDESRIGESPVVAALEAVDRAFSIRASFGGLREAYDVVRDVEEGLRERSFEVLYETEGDALRMLRGGAVDAVLLTPRLTKECIVRTALAGEVFCYKATRHVVPARPLHVDVPLGWLGGDRGLDEVRDKLGRMLRRRRLRHVIAGSVFGGRRYEEDVYVFEG